MRAGTSVYGDRQQWVLGSIPAEGCAVAVAATVVSVFDDRIVLDAGAKALTKDRADWLTGYGAIAGYPDARDRAPERLPRRRRGAGRRARGRSSARSSRSSRTTSARSWTSSTGSWSSTPTDRSRSGRSTRAAGAAEAVAPATGLVVEPMTDADADAVIAIYAQGIASGNATLETAVPDWSHWHTSHRRDCRFVARLDGAVVGWTAIGRYSHARGLRRRGLGERLRRGGGSRPGRGPGAPRRPDPGGRGGRRLDADGRRPRGERGEPRAPRTRRVPPGRDPGADRPRRGRPLARRRPARAPELDAPEAERRWRGPNSRSERFAAPAPVRMGDRGHTGRDGSRGRGGSRPRGAGPSGRPRGVRRPGAPGQRTRSTRSPTGSSATRGSPRTRCRTPSSWPGAGCRTCGMPSGSRPGSTGSSSTPATTRPSGPGTGRRTSGCCRSTDRRPRRDRRRRRLATSWNAPSGGSRSSSGRSSSCTTTSGCPWSRSPRCSSIPAGTARSRLHYATQGLRAALIGDAEPVLQKGRLGMTDDRSLERAARSWLESGPTEAPDRAVDAALLRIQTTRQDRVTPVPWRLPKMDWLWLVCSPVSRPSSSSPSTGLVLLRPAGAWWARRRSEPQPRPQRRRQRGSSTAPTVAPSPSATVTPPVAACGLVTSP